MNHLFSYFFLNIFTQQATMHIIIQHPIIIYVNGFVMLISFSIFKLNIEQIVIKPIIYDISKIQAEVNIILSNLLQ